MIKLVTLNLWGYNDWSNRLDNLVKLFNQVQPDIVALQEVRKDSKFYPEPQSSVLAQLCKFSYQIYVPTYREMITENGEERSVHHGLAIISKHPILESEAIILESLPDDNEPAAILISEIKINNKKLLVCNVHFENNDLSAERHLRQTVKLMEDKNISPIILGDFNIYKLGNYRQILTNYVLSTDVVSYVSYPRDNGTLDYVILPKSSYDFDKVRCLEPYDSDHRAVEAQIRKKYGGNITRLWCYSCQVLRDINPRPEQTTLRRS